MGLVAKESVNSRQSITTDAPSDVLHPAVLENSRENDACIALRIQIRKPVLWEQPSQATRKGHAREHITRGAVPPLPRRAGDHEHTRPRPAARLVSNGGKAGGSPRRTRLPRWSMMRRHRVLEPASRLELETYGLRKGGAFGTRGGQAATRRATGRKQ